MTIPPALVNQLRLNAHRHSDRNRAHHAIGRDDKSGDLFVICTDGTAPKGWTVVATLADLDGPGFMAERESRPRCIHCGQYVTVDRQTVWHTLTGTTACDAIEDGDGWSEPEGWETGRRAEVGS